MNKYRLFVLVLSLINIMAIEESAFANRFTDSWAGSRSRIHGHFYKKDERGFGPVATLIISSSTIAVVSTTAMTSGGNMLKEVSMRDEFIDQNLYAIQLDSAKGQGEYLQTLATLSGCEGIEAQGQFSSAIRSNFSGVYKNAADSDATIIADHIDDMIDADTNLRGLCRNIRAVGPTI